jgi:NAD(P)H-dependent FMN reductase
MPKLQVLIASTRPGRVGPAVAEWFVTRAREVGGFEIEVVDLAEVDLPFMDEPNHPMLRQYTKEHTFRWSALVDSADAFVFVMPEYNYGFNAQLKNSLDYLNWEWRYKPVGFVSYGGVAAGTRAVQMIKQVVTALQMMPLAQAVHIPFVRKFINEDGRFEANAELEAGADAMLAELRRWTVAMAPLRAEAAQAA